MDIGDIIRLIFFGIIFLSFFGGFFGRKSGEEKQAPSRPTDLSQSGGEPQAPRPVRTQTAEPQAHEVLWEDAPLGRQAQAQQTRSSSGRDTSTYDDAIEAGDVSRAEPRRQRPASRPGNMVERTDVRSAERQMLEQDLTDMPAAMDLNPERRPRAPQQAPVSRRRRQRTDAQILRGWLEDPDTLGRAFIVKEVLDPPVGMRDQR